MSHVYVANCAADGASFDLRCGICGHEQTVPAEHLAFPLLPDGSKDFRFLRIECPACLAVSTWPISGGAAGSGTPQLEAIQRAFAYRYNHDPDEPSTSPADGRETLRRRLQEMGGADAGKWALDGWVP